jgi:hypothetical protein
MLRSRSQSPPGSMAIVAGVAAAQAVDSPGTQTSIHMAKPCMSLFDRG